MEDPEEYSREEMHTLIDAMLEERQWDVYRIWHEKSKLDYPANVGVGSGHDAQEGLNTFLANNPEAKEGAHYVCEGPGDTPSVANPFNGFPLVVTDGQII